MSRSRRKSKIRRKPCGKYCHYCYPATVSYKYKGHGRIKHTDIKNTKPEKLFGEDSETV